MSEECGLNAETDPALALVQHYFFPAAEMHTLVHRDIDQAFAAPGGPEWQRFRINLRFWLSALYVVCEGYLALNLSDPELDALIPEHLNDLRRFRNSTFHYQKTVDKEVAFFDGTANRLNWAECLHAEFKRFFSEYAAEIAAGSEIEYSRARREGK